MRSLASALRQRTQLYPRSGLELHVRRTRISAPLAWTACAAKTKRSPVNSPPTHPRPPTRQRSTLSPINSAKSSRRATPTNPKHCCASSSPSYESTAATRSCPPTVSAHLWFAHRQVQWGGGSSRLLKGSQANFRLHAGTQKDPPNRLVSNAFENFLDLSTNSRLGDAMTRPFGHPWQRGAPDDIPG